MIDNNLDFDVALYPYELVTYGETGSVCQNWMQYRLIKKYLEELTEDQTLVVASGHPLGLFESRPSNPRVIITNGLMVGTYDNPDDWEIAAQMGVASYGQMTAGGWMYIGPQGIVHGTYNTLLNAGRIRFGLGKEADLKGRLFVSSGLGGMSGAQPKAAEIAGAVSIIAEVDASRIQTRHTQGWVNHVSADLGETFAMAHEAMQAGRPLSIAFHGNIVDLLAYAVDQTRTSTCCRTRHPAMWPIPADTAPRASLLKNGPGCWRKTARLSANWWTKACRRHIELVEILVDRGVFFFDYGNAFLKAVFDAGVTKISKNGVDEKDGFIFPSYFEDIMGPHIFDFGYGPFRWVCLSGQHDDLIKTDRAAMACIDPDRRFQDRDNWAWIRDAEKNSLVVGTQARILYQDAAGRIGIALKFNEMVRKGESAPS